MTLQALLIEVRWPDGRFHGVREAPATGRRGDPVASEWPPSPFRLFQALVAGAYGGRWVAEDAPAQAAKDAAFAWLEGLHPPVVAAPSSQRLAKVTYYVPNNDLDTKDGDPDRVNEIRSAKVLRTSLFDADRPVAYLWTFEGDAGPAERMVELAGRLHTLGHGIDAAFAHAEVLDAEAGEARLRRLGGGPRRPSLARTPTGSGAGPATEATPCPTRGSLDSLRRRHAAFTGRLARHGTGRKAVTRFSQPPKAHARAVAYERAPARLLYELRPVDGGAPFAAWALADAAALTRAVRDMAADALARVQPDEAERCVLGRGAGEADKARRLRILPLPSAGTAHTEMSIRRVLVEVPPDHPFDLPDVEWALAGREPALADGLLTGRLLTPASDRRMLDAQYLATARVWRTVTPAVLPWRGVHGRASGPARAEAEQDAARAVADALRHAGVETPVENVRVQREPFDQRGERADAFDLAPLSTADAPARAHPRDLRHVEVTFAGPVAGPLAIGNGRWLGLGVMRAVPEARVRPAERDGVHVLRLPPGFAVGEAAVEPLCRALRRAVMSRAGAGLKRDVDLPLFFTGHEPRVERGRPTPPARDGGHRHLFFAVDPGGAERPARLLVIAPHRADRSRVAAATRSEFRRRRSELDAAVEGLDDLRAGALGRLALSPERVEAADPALDPARAWTSLTPYRPTRHPKRGEDRDAGLVADLQAEAARRGLPRPAVVVLACAQGPRGGLAARLRLTFQVAVAGPILLGRDAHFGAGLFGREAG